MTEDSEHFDDRSAEGRERRSPALQTLWGGADYDTAALGYEAANPSLQTPLWCQAMQGSSEAPD